LNPLLPLIITNMSGPGASSAAILAKNLFNLEGRVALVTGGATGIGLMCAHALAVNGARTYIVGRREEVLKKSADLYSPNEGPGAIIPLQADITSKETILKLVKEFSQKESALHILVNNAGVAREENLKFSNNESLDFKSAQSISDHLLRADFSNWAETMETNVTAMYMTSAAFLPLLEKGNETIRGYTSTIINTTSISGIMKGPSSGQYAYSASKAAAIQLTKNLANSLTDVKIRVNTIAPGIFPSEMTAGESAGNNKSELPDSGKGLPAGRPGKDEDMAGAVLYLASRAGVFSNGLILHTDGGALVTMPSSL